MAVNTPRVESALMDDMSVYAAWTQAVSRHGQYPAIITPAGEWTYAEIDVWAAGVASRINDLQLASGDRVAIAGANSADYLVLILALTRLGIVIVPLDPTLTPSEFEALVEHSGSAWTFIDDESSKKIMPESIGIRYKRLEDFVAISDSDRQLGFQAEPVKRGPDDLWAIMYTSGSTSKPRGVLIPQKAFAVTGLAMSEALEYTSEDVVGSVLPAHHASVTLMSWAPAVMTGSAFALSGRFSRSGFWDFIADSGVTVMTTVPTIAEILLTAEPSEGDSRNSLRMLITHREMPEFASRFDVDVRALWGMTETSGLGCVQRSDDPPGTVGRPYPDEADVAIVDQDGNEVPDGSPGELMFRHPATMVGYLDEPPLQHGWIASGDLAVRNPDGSIAYVGRSKNMIKRGGENVSLEEIERIIIEHPSVAEVVTVAVPDPIFIEEACAVVVWKDEQPELSSLRRYCESKLATWKNPRYILTWESSLPKLANLKIDRAAIKAAIELQHADDRSRN